MLYFYVFAIFISQTFGCGVRFVCVCVFVIAKAIAHDGFHNANSSGTIY